VSLTLFLAAGEPSGDVLGAALMRALKAETGGGVRFLGVGGPQMAAEGLDTLFPQAELAVMGLVEVLPSLPRLMRRMAQTVEACVAAAPAALVTIDSPSFGLRVARKVKAAAPAIRTVHYGAPQVWAWKPGRAKRMAAYVDHVMALLPFEPPYFTRHGLSCDFVGHPAATRPAPDAAAVAAIRAEAEAQKRAAFAAADAALAASGTVTLELAAAGTPTVAAYRAHPLTAAIVRFMLTVDTAILVNLVASEKVVPEFLQERLRPPAVADALSALLDDPAARARQAAGFDKAMTALGRGGPTAETRAARSLLAALERPGKGRE
jgi:lipid-A-disaccharide synthase